VAAETGGGAPAGEGDDHAGGDIVIDGRHGRGGARAGGGFRVRRGCHGGRGGGAGAGGGGGRLSTAAALCGDAGETAGGRGKGAPPKCPRKRRHWRRSGKGLWRGRRGHRGARQKTG